MDSWHASSHPLFGARRGRFNVRTAAMVMRCRLHVFRLVA